MAATTAGARLSEAHRLAQARLGAQVVGQLLASWRLLDIRALDQTFPEWLRVIAPLVRFQRGVSSNLAAEYVTAFRVLEGPGPIVATLAPPLPEAQLVTSLAVTGPAALKRNMTTMTLAQALERAKVSSAGAAMRHVLNGGRDTILRTVEHDDAALGWARTTSGTPCSFCAMLASRGPVYKSEQTGDFKAHDHCHCGTEPVYSKDADWPPGARDYQALWQESTRGHSGKAALNAFRRAFEAA